MKKKKIVVFILLLSALVVFSKPAQTAATISGPNAQIGILVHSPSATPALQVKH
jgi:hypothetical protein